MTLPPQAFRWLRPLTCFVPACYLALAACDSSPTEPNLGTAWAAVTTGEEHSCGLTNSGHAFCWGRNTSGQVGVFPSPSGREALPVPVETELRFTHLSAGRRLTCGVTADFEVYCWGEDAAGGRGEDPVSRCSQDGEPQPCPHIPTRIASDARFVTVSVAGSYKHWDHTVRGGPVCALDVDGVAYCWGYGSFGARGDGTARHTRVPTPVVGDLRFAQIDAGEEGCCGVTDGGELYCWGQDLNHRLVHQYLTHSAEPLRIGDGQDFASVRIGPQHACALTRDGEVQCWGANHDGAIGDGTLDERDVPTSVDSDIDFSSVTVGYRHTCATTSGGPVYCWGRAGYTATGSETIGGMVLSPTPTVSSLVFSTVACSRYHTCGVTTAGEAYCWGEGYALGAGEDARGYKRFPIRVLWPE